MRGSLSRQSDEEGDSRIALVDVVGRVGCGWTHCRVEIDGCETARVCGGSSCGPSPYVDVDARSLVSVSAMPSVPKHLAQLVAGVHCAVWLLTSACAGPR